MTSQRLARQALKLITLVVALTSGATIATVTNEPTKAQTVLVCTASSGGGSGYFFAQTSCPIQAYYTTYATLSKYTDPPGSYTFYASASSPGSFGYYDIAASYVSTPSGYYLTEGNHVVSAAGYIPNPAYGYTYWYFTT
jgi:hypothetical protein